MPMPVSVHLEDDRALRDAHPHRDAPPAGRELDRVADEIVEDLHQPLGVAEHHEVARGPLAAEVDPLGLGSRPDGVECLGKDGAEGDRIEPDLHLAPDSSPTPRARPR